ncbi:unnamed protein product [Musa acuminata subsp. burmannicoides]
MTVNSLQAREVSDLCIGKPATRPLSLSATVGDALLALRSGGSDDRLVIWTADGPAPERKACAGNVCLVDVLCYLCAEQNLDAPMAALGAPASALLPPLTAASLVRRVEPSCSILEALDAILDGAQSLVVPIRAAASPRKFTSGSAAELCWLTREDFVRFFLNSIALFSPVPALSVTDLGLVRPAALAVRPQDPALSALPPHPRRPRRADIRRRRLRRRPPHRRNLPLYSGPLRRARRPRPSCSLRRRPDDLCRLRRRPAEVRHEVHQGPTKGEGAAGHARAPRRRRLPAILAVDVLVRVRR